MTLEEQMIAMRKCIVEWRIITPEKAVEMLKGNTNNRKVKIRDVHTYAHDMKTGKWKANGETIVIGADGKVLDGQHRLMACVEAGTPFLSLVVEYPPESGNYDTGIKRSTLDTMTIDGADPDLCNQTFPRAAKLHFQIAQGRTKVSDAEVLEFLTRNKDSFMLILNLMKEIGDSERLKLTTSAIFLACVYAFKCGVSTDVLKRFMIVAKDGFTPDENEKAAIVFREDWITSASLRGGGGGSSRAAGVYVVEKAIYEFAHGAKRNNSFNSWKKPIYSAKDVCRNM